MVILSVSGLILLVCALVQSAELPIGKCSLDDKACLQLAFQKMLPIFVGGMPQYDVDVLDPMDMSDMNVDMNGLKFHLTKGVLTGWKAAVVEDVEWDTKNQVFSIGFHSNIGVTGDYTAAGKLAVHPISGVGQVNLKMDNLYIKLFIHYDLVKIDGKDHVKPTKYNFEFQVKDGANYYLGNLFDGDKEKSDFLLKFLNDNWKDITAGFGSPLIDTVSKDLFKNISNFFAKMALEDIANV